MGNPKKLEVLKAADTPNHVKILKLGVKYWNEWRVKNPTIEPNLQGADLQGTDLQEFRLSWTDLQDVKLQGVNLQGAKLIGAKLQGADLYRADLRWAELQGANLQGAKLQGAALQWANLQGANLHGAKLMGAKLQDANLQNANLQCVKLQDADLHGTKLLGAKLQQANLQGANLQGANLIRAGLQEAELREATLQGAALHWTNLQGADLHGADLHGATLHDTDLREANLRYANFQGADLRNANLQDAKLQGADLLWAQLKGTLFSSRVQLREVLVPIYPEQEQNIIFRDEEAFEKALDESQWAGRDGSGLLLTFSRKSWRPVDIANLVLSIELAVNRLQYLLSTDDDHKTIQKRLRTPCYHAQEQGVRIDFKEGSLEVFLAYLAEYSEGLQLVLKTLGLIGGAVYGFFAIRKTIKKTEGHNLDNRIKEKQLACSDNYSAVAADLNDNVFDLSVPSEDIHITKELLPLSDRFTDEETNDFGHQAIDSFLASVRKEFREGYNVTINIYIDGTKKSIPAEE